MGTLGAKSQPLRRAQCLEDLLGAYYGQLLKWAILITRGDESMARDIVHDLCLHFMAAKPDMGEVENLEGYLYTSLRYLYLSALEKTSRDANRLVNVADYDSIHFALQSGSPERMLQSQNDIRRICSYEIWRKDTSKSASYLTLLFFHGYSRSEIASVACAPLSAIYNKLKIAREELKGYLAQSGALTIVRGDAPPVPALRVTVVPFVELFDELRTAILNSRSTECLTAEVLLAYYRSSDCKPIPCSLLSHIVSCERCLSLIDRHFQRPTLNDREPPLDSTDRTGNQQREKSSDNGQQVIMRSAKWHRNRVFDHRPQTLSIAVNGRITAFHDVQSEKSTLCSRIENPDSAQFIEVFSDQHIRLAMLPVGERPPTGQHSQTQRITLSDHRWLELTLRFDGLGLDGEVTYVDPTLAIAATSDDAEDLPLGAADTESAETIPLINETEQLSWTVRVQKRLRGMFRQPVWAWSAIVVIVAFTVMTGYQQLAWRWSPSKLLAKTKQMEAADLNGCVEHRLFRLEATEADGHSVTGTIDLWRGSNGRHLRRLYDSSHHLLAEDWQASDSQRGSTTTSDAASLPAEERALISLGIWKQDVSAEALDAMAPHQLTLRSSAETYEITATGIGEGLRITSATLVFDRQLHAIGEILRIQAGNTLSTARLMQTTYERRPAASVPASLFEPSHPEPQSDFQRQSPDLAQSVAKSSPFAANIRIATLEVAVLAQLNKIGADLGEPLQLERIPIGHLRVEGVVESLDRKQQIVAALEAIPDRKLLDVEVVAQQEISVPRGLSRRDTAGSFVYTVDNFQSPADSLIKTLLSQQGVSSDRLPAMAAQFTRDTLGHAQRALQEAYALDRLGNGFSLIELKEMDQGSEHQWAQMAAQHASALNRELRALHAQLSQLTPLETQGSTAHDIAEMIQRPDQFARAVHRLLLEIQHLNSRTAMAFTSGSLAPPKEEADTLVREVAQSIPMRDANSLDLFASRLATSDDAARASNRR